mmetsp:Transcript_4016/g.5312  ORF Transcript_4016/g.5312 Transcript_4016/m.5312 type:complete len:204 (+) Transcript_4016:993-1604(+)
MVDRHSVSSSRLSKEPLTRPLSSQKRSLTLTTTLQPSEHRTAWRMNVPCLDSFATSQPRVYKSENLLTCRIVLSATDSAFEAFRRRGLSHFELLLVQSLGQSLGDRDDLRKPQRPNLLALRFAFGLLWAFGAADGFEHDSLSMSSVGLAPAGCTIPLANAAPLPMASLRTLPGFAPLGGRHSPAATQRSLLREPPGCHEGGTT